MNGRKLALGLAAAATSLVALVLGARLLAGNPSGPPESSYATTPGGVAAYAELLARTGVRVERVRESPAQAQADLRPIETVFALGATALSRADAKALRSFVEEGGRLVVSGKLARKGWIAALLDSPPSWSSERLPVSRPLASSETTAGISRVESASPGSWTSPGGGRALLGSGDRSLLVEATRGRGTIDLLATASPLTNELLAKADNAALGVRLAGPPQLRELGKTDTLGLAVFLEGIHGYAPASGLAALPDRFRWAFALFALAAVVFVAARFRRLGPPELAARPLPPARIEYVESIARSVALTRDRADALEPLRLASRKQLATVGGVADEDEALRGTARELGFERDVGALLVPALKDESVLALGRTAAKIRRMHGGRRAGE
ncbi:MAG: hypothetical protein QOE29_369 [Gaiellaceae bacterium]|nr:hypothetical protein [Gaiellaceae bacterium]